MDTADLSIFESRLGYRFQNRELLQQALTHRSYSSDHNERLEFLGDSLVNTLIAEQLYRMYPDAAEGDLSAMRASLVRRETLADIASSLGFSDAILLGGGASKSGGHRLQSILADAYEAVLGAIYLDSEWSVLSKTVKTHFDGRLDQLQIEDIRDAKSRLQEFLQARSLNLPEYRMLDVDGPGHAQHFRIQCVIDSLIGEFFGEGSSRKIAEQQAAAKALEALEASDGENDVE